MMNSIGLDINTDFHNGCLLTINRRRQKQAKHHDQKQAMQRFAFFCT